MVFRPMGDVIKDGKSQKAASVGTTEQQNSLYRGATKHHCMVRYHAHLWDNIWEVKVSDWGDSSLIFISYLESSGGGATIHWENDY